VDAELTKDAWVMTVPIASNYTVREAAWVLGATIAWVASLEGLIGPESSPIRPVDHAALARFVLVRARKRKRQVARRQLKQVLKHHLGE
jgi:hypothetical protein